MAQVIALNKHQYAGKRRDPGDQYEIRSSSDLLVATALKWVVKVPPVEVPREDDDQPKRRGRPRKYQRRDLTAE